MFPYLRPFWKQALLATLLAFPLAGIKAYEAFLVKDIFDKGFASGSSSDDARKLALLLIGLGIINYPLRYFHYFSLRQIVDKSTIWRRLK
jgi:ABC-type multidrug transport system fused ATPase/permease subunit